MATEADIPQIIHKTNKEGEGGSLSSETLKLELNEFEQDETRKVEHTHKEIINTGEREDMQVETNINVDTANAVFGTVEDQIFIESSVPQGNFHDAETQFDRDEKSTKTVESTENLEEILTTTNLIDKEKNLSQSEQIKCEEDGNPEETEYLGGEKQDQDSITEPKKTEEPEISSAIEWIKENNQMEENKFMDKVVEENVVESSKNDDKIEEVPKEEKLEELKAAEPNAEAQTQSIEELDNVKLSSVTVTADKNSEENVNEKETEVTESKEEVKNSDVENVEIDEDLVEKISSVPHVYEEETGEEIVHKAEHPGSKMQPESYDLVSDTYKSRGVHVVADPVEATKFIENENIQIQAADLVDEKEEHEAESQNQNPSDGLTTDENLVQLQEKFTDPEIHANVASKDVEMVNPNEELPESTKAGESSHVGELQALRNEKSENIYLDVVDNFEGENPAKETFVEKSNPSIVTKEAILTQEDFKVRSDENVEIEKPDVEVTEETVASETKGTTETAEEAIVTTRKDQDTIKRVIEEPESDKECIPQSIEPKTEQSSQDVQKTEDNESNDEEIAIVNLPSLASVEKTIQGSFEGEERDVLESTKEIENSDRELTSEDIKDGTESDATSAAFSNETNEDAAHKSAVPEVYEEQTEEEDLQKADDISTEEKKVTEGDKPQEYTLVETQEEQLHIRDESTYLASADIEKGSENDIVIPEGEKLLKTEFEEKSEDHSPAVDVSTEACETSADIKNDILEEEQSVSDFNNSLAEDINIKKEVDELVVGGHIQETETSESKITSTEKDEEIDDNKSAPANTDIEETAQTSLSSSTIAEESLGEEEKPITVSKDEVTNTDRELDLVENSSVPSVFEKETEEIVHESETITAGVTEATTKEELDSVDNNNDQVSEFEGSTNVELLTPNISDETDIPAAKTLHDFVLEQNPEESHATLSSEHAILTTKEVHNDEQHIPTEQIEEGVNESGNREAGVEAVSSHNEQVENFDEEKLFNVKVEKDTLEDTVNKTSNGSYQTSVETEQASQEQEYSATNIETSVKEDVELYKESVEHKAGETISEVEVLENQDSVETQEQLSSDFEQVTQEKTNEGFPLSDKIDYAATIPRDFNLGEIKNTENLAEANEGADELEGKPDNDVQQETYDMSSKIEDATTERSSVHTTEPNLEDSSTVLLEEQNHETAEAINTADKSREKVETSPFSTYAPSSADTVEDKLLQEQIEPQSPREGTYLVPLDTKENSINDESDKEGKEPVVDAPNEAFDTSLEIESVTIEQVKDPELTENPEITTDNKEKTKSEAVEYENSKPYSETDASKVTPADETGKNPDEKEIGEKILHEPETVTTAVTEEAVLEESDCADIKDANVLESDENKNVEILTPEISDETAVTTGEIPRDFVLEQDHKEPYATSLSEHAILTEVVRDDEQPIPAQHTEECVTASGNVELIKNSEAGDVAEQVENFDNEKLNVEEKENSEDPVNKTLNEACHESVETEQASEEQENSTNVETHINEDAEIHKETQTIEEVEVSESNCTSILTEEVKDPELTEVTTNNKEEKKSEAVEYDYSKSYSERDASIVTPADEISEHLDEKEIGEEILHEPETVTTAVTEEAVLEESDCADTKDANVLESDENKNVEILRPEISDETAAPTGEIPRDFVLEQDPKETYATSSSEHAILNEVVRDDEQPIPAQHTEECVTASENVEILQNSEAGDVAEQVDNFDSEKVNVEEKENSEDPVNKTLNEACHTSAETEQSSEELENSATTVESHINDDAEIQKEAQTIEEVEVSESNCTCIVTDEVKDPELTEVTTHNKKETESEAVEYENSKSYSETDTSTVTPADETSEHLDEKEIGEKILHEPETVTTAVTEEAVIEESDCADIRDANVLESDENKNVEILTSEISEERAVPTGEIPRDFVLEQDTKEPYATSSSEHAILTEVVPVDEQPIPAQHTVECVTASGNVELSKNSEAGDVAEQVENFDNEKFNVDEKENFEDPVNKTLNEACHATVETEQASEEQENSATNVETHINEDAKIQKEALIIEEVEVSESNCTSTVTEEKAESVETQEQPSSNFEPDIEDKSNEIVPLSDDIDIPATIPREFDLGENKNTEILTEVKEGADLLEEKPDNNINEETHKTSSVIEDEEEVVTAERSSVYTAEKDLEDSSTDLLKAHSQVTTEASETANEIESVSVEQVKDSELKENPEVTTYTDTKETTKHEAEETGTPKLTADDETSEDLVENTSVPDVIEKEIGEEILYEPEIINIGVPEAATLEEFESSDIKHAPQEATDDETSSKKDAELFTNAVELKETTLEADISETDCTSTVAEEIKENVETPEQARSEFEPVVEVNSHEVASLSDEIDVSSKDVLDEKKTTEILTEANTKSNESEEKPGGVTKEETCDKSSVIEDEKEIVAVDRSSDYTTEQNLEDSSTDLLDEHNRAPTEASEAENEPQEKVETSPRYVPSAADTEDISSQKEIEPISLTDGSYLASPHTEDIETVTLEQGKDSELKENPEVTTYSDKEETKKFEAAETDTLKVTPAAETSEDLAENTLPSVVEKEIGEEILHEPETITTEVPEAANLEEIEHSDIKHAQDSEFDERKNVELLTPEEISDERDVSAGETPRDIVLEQDLKESYATTISDDADLTTEEVYDDEQKVPAQHTEKSIHESAHVGSLIISEANEVAEFSNTEQVEKIDDEKLLDIEAEDIPEDLVEKTFNGAGSGETEQASQEQEHSSTDVKEDAELFTEAVEQKAGETTKEVEVSEIDCTSTVADEVSKEVEEAKESVEEEVENKMEIPDQTHKGNLENTDSPKSAETRDLQESENQSGEPELDMDKDEPKPVSITSSEMKTSEEQIEDIVPTKMNHEPEDLEPSAEVECRTELDDEERNVQALQETKTEEDIQGGGTEMPLKVEPTLAPKIQSRETEVSFEKLGDDILTEEDSVETEKAEKSEKEEEEISAEHQIKLESTEMITDPAPFPLDNFEATVPCESTETVKELAAEEVDLDLEQSLDTKELDEERKIITEELIINNTSLVSAISEDKFEDESTKEPPGSIDETHTAPVKPATEDEIPEEVQEVEKSTRDFETTSDDKTREVIAISTDIQEENTYQVEEPKHSDTISQSEVQNVEYILENHKVPLGDSNSDDIVESEKNPQNTSASEVLLQETLPSANIEDKGVSESYFATSTEKEAGIAKEEPRELEASDLKLKSKEDCVDDSPREAEKEESAYLGESISVAQQEEISEKKFVDFPSEHDKSMDIAKTTDRESKEISEEDTLYAINSNSEALDLPRGSSTVKEISSVEVDETCQVPSTPDIQKTEKVFESVIGEEAEKKTETTEQQKFTEITEPEAEEHQSAIANESITKEIIEKEIAKDSAVGSPDLETVGKDVQLAEEYSKVKNIQKFDSITNAIQNEELPKVQTASLDENKQEQVLANEGSLEEEEMSGATEAPNTGSTALNEEVKHEEEKEILINKEALNIPNVVEDAQAEEEAPKVLQELEEICEDVPKEPVHEILQVKHVNTDVEEKNIDISEKLEDGEKPDNAACELTFDAHDITDDMNLKEQSISPNEESSYIISEKQTATREIIPEEIKFNKNEIELPSDKEKVEEFDEPKIHSTVSAYGDTKTQDQGNVLSQVNNSSVETTESNKVDLVSDKDSYPEVQQVPEKQIFQESGDFKLANASAIEPGKTQTEETREVDRSLLIEQRDAKEITTPVEEENEDEHERVDSGSDGPVLVEASTDVTEKTVPSKKSHNILSGVGSKVKHSIAKVRKVITGKSSHPKPSSPK